MLHLKVNELNFAAFDSPVKIRGGALKSDVKAAFSGLLDRFLASEEPIDASQTEFIDTLINESFISYEQHTRLYDETMQIDF